MNQSKYSRNNKNLFKNLTFCLIYINKKKLEI